MKDINLQETTNIVLRLLADKDDGSLTDIRNFVKSIYDGVVVLTDEKTELLSSIETMLKEKETATAHFVKELTELKDKHEQELDDAKKPTKMIKRTCGTCDHKYTKDGNEWCALSGLYCTHERRAPQACGKYYERWIPRRSFLEKILEVFFGADDE